MKKDFKAKEEIAIKRFEIVAPLCDPELSKRERVDLQRAMADSNGVSYRTIGRWKELYIEYKILGLMPKDISHDDAKVLGEEVIKKAIAYRRENPLRSIRDIIMILEMENVVKPGEVKRSTLQRYMQESGYSKSQMKRYAADPDPAAAAKRFQKEHRMDLVQGDVKYGPLIDGKRTYLICWIDDCTRYIIYSRFYFSEDAASICHSFKQALCLWGKPKRILLDNGSGYVSDMLASICANLGIVKSHCRPRCPNQKGKVEIYNKLIDKYLTEMDLEQWKTIDDLNKNYIAWEHGYYLTQKHSSLKNLTPLETFTNDSRSIFHLTKEEIEEAFLCKENKLISASGTFKLDGEEYQVTNLELCRKQVTVSYDPTDMKDIIVSSKDFPDCKATPFVIGVNVDFALRKTAAPRPDSKVDGSRMIRNLNKKFDEEFPDNDLSLNTAEVKEIIQEAEAEPMRLSYASANKEDADNV